MSGLFPGIAKGLGPYGAANGLCEFGEFSIAEGNSMRAGPDGAVANCAAFGAG